MSHLPYLQDEALIIAFKRAIKEKSDLIRDKIVLEIGCGPGAHLSMLCVQVPRVHRD